MLVLWDEGISYWQVGLAYAFVGTGVGSPGHRRRIVLRGPYRSRARAWRRHRRSPARPRPERSCSRSWARCSRPDTRVRWRPRSRSGAGSVHDHDQDQLQTVLRQREHRRGAEPEVRDADHGGRAVVRSSTVRTGLRGGDHRILSRCARLSSCSEARGRGATALRLRARMRTPTDRPRSAPPRFAELDDKRLWRR